MSGSEKANGAGRRRMDPAEAKKEIVDAFRDLFVRERAAAPSFRSIAAQAGISPNLVSYYFPDRDALIVDVLTRALPEFRASLAELSDLNAVAGAGLSRASAFSLWVSGAVRARRDVFRIWGEALVQARHSEVVAEAVRPWVCVWQRAWSADNDFHQRILSEYAVAEMIGLLPLSDMTDYALIMSEAFLRYEARRAGVVASEADERTWYKHICRPSFDDKVHASSVMNDVKRSLLDASADIISEQGASAVSHRSVAQRAGASLSSTTYHFDGREALVRGGIGRLFERLVASPDTAPRRGDSLLETIQMIGPGEYEPGTPERARGSAALAIAEIALEASVNPEIRSLSWELRRIRGLITRQSLSRTVSPWLKVSGSDAMDFAIWRSGLVLLGGAAPELVTYTPEQTMRVWRLHFPPADWSS